MDWLDKMNAAMDYIEDNLDGEIDNNVIAQKACCSVYNFQRMFSFITDVTLAEYIRRRRLTQAAFELQHKEISILTLAIKYGYDSPISFARAFFHLHGVNPSEAKKDGIKLKSYPKLSFTLSIKGVEDLNYRIEKMRAMHFIGMSHAVPMIDSVNFNVVPKLWDQCYENDDHMKLSSLGTGECPALLGLCHSFKKEEFQYMIGLESDAQVPEGMMELCVPEMLWVKFECVGPLPNSIQNVWKRFYNEWFPNSGYEIEDGPEIEWYSFGDTSSDDYKSEIWIPIRSIT